MADTAPCNSYVSFSTRSQHPVVKLDA